MEKLPSIYIRRDTREKDNKGWFFDEEIKRPGKVQILGTVEESLDAADYTIKGYESIVRIERKQGFSELFNNLMNKENKERFERELEKLKKVKHKYLIVESFINDDILSLSVPQFKVGPTVNKVIEMLFEYHVYYDLVPIFAGSSGKKIASNIFKNIARIYRIQNATS